MAIVGIQAEVTERTLPVCVQKDPALKASIQQVFKLVDQIIKSRERQASASSGSRMPMNRGKRGASHQPSQRLPRPKHFSWKGSGSTPNSSTSKWFASSSARDSPPTKKAKKGTENKAADESPPLLDDDVMRDLYPSEGGTKGVVGRGAGGSMFPAGEQELPASAAGEAESCPDSSQVLSV